MRPDGARQPPQALLAKTGQLLADGQRRADDPALSARVTSALSKAHAALVAQRHAAADQLHQALGLKAPSADAMAQGAAPSASQSFLPLLFVSSSMPIDELRTYARQIETTGGALVFRGMPGGLHRVAPMAELSAQILRVDPNCSGPACQMRAVSILVDPIAFRRHGVTVVPTLAMASGDPTTAYCERDAASDGLDILVTGDASLSGMLDDYSRLGGETEVRDAQARLVGR